MYTRYKSLLIGWRVLKGKCDRLVLVSHPTTCLTDPAPNLAAEDALNWLESKGMKSAIIAELVVKFGLGNLG